MNDRQDTYESDDELQVPRSPNLMVTSPTLFMEQETQTSLKSSEPYHPPAEKLKVRKTRHRRASSYSSNGAPLSPRLSPMRERRISSGSPRRSQNGSVADVEETIDDGQQEQLRQLFFRHQTETEASMTSGHLTATSPEAMIAIRSRHSTSGSSSSSEEVCQIVDDDPDNDILETLDRKVSEVINRSRMNSNSAGGGLGAGAGGGSNNNADIYGPLSFSYNRRASRTSPGSVARRLSPSRRQSEVSGLVRFGGDDEDDEAVKVGGNLTDDDSSADDHDGDRVNWSDDDEEYPKPESTLNNAFTIKRKR